VEARLLPRRLVGFRRWIQWKPQTASEMRRTEMNDRSERPGGWGFDDPSCIRCGECFHRCPELHLPIDVAKAEIEALRNGQDGGFVLQHCTTCFSCNLYCRNDGKPYQLILENWNRLYRERGAPPMYRFMCPTLEGSIFQMLEALMSEQERQVVEAWMNQEPKQTILLIGNYTHLYPFILGNSRLLDFFTPVDLLDHWEVGATLYQGGYLDVVRRIGEKCRQEFDSWNVKTVVPFLDAVHHMLCVVQPQEMGVAFDQEILNFNDWLLKTIDRGEIELRRGLDIKVTLHDNCFSKAGGDAYFDRARELIERTGCEIVEMEHVRCDSRCCGFGAGASWERNMNIPFDIFATSRAKFDEAEATGAEALVTYCTGCLYLLCAAKELFRSDLKVYHHVELVRMAMGEDLGVTQEMRARRAWDVIAIISYHMLLGLFRGSFEIRDLSFGEERWRDRRFWLFRLMRKLLATRAGRAAYRRIASFLMPRLRRKRPEFELRGAEM
jgi:Fe-S oxidoreductase